MLRAATTSIARRAVASQRFSSRGVPAFAGQNLFHSSAAKLQEESKPPATEPEKKKGFWDPVYSIPIGISIAVPVLKFEWYVINEETQLAACFMMFVMLIWKNFGGFIHEYLSADGKRIFAEHWEIEEKIIKVLKEQRADIQLLSDGSKLTEDYSALREETYEKLNAAGKIKPQHEFKAQVERLLALVVQEEGSVVEKAKQALMKEATASVKASFVTDKKLKKTSLEAAISQLEGKAQSKVDPVQAAFVNFFKAKKASQIDESAEIAANRAILINKMNALAANEEFFFKLDETTGQPQMQV